MDEMNHKAHEVIRQVFGIRYKKSTLPYGTPRKFGKRERFAELFAKLGACVGAEIGVRHGEFTKVLCKANQQLKMYCIDPWAAYQRYDQKKQDAIYESAVSNLTPYNAVIIRKTSMDALEDVKDGELDFVYIDGNHEFDFVMMDLICWAKKVRYGGIIALHDYHAGYWYGVMQAVNAYTFCHRIDPWYVLKATQPTAFWVNEPEDYILP